MRILIDIGHPGHVHLFRPFAKEMIAKGHKILFTYRQKEFEGELLAAAGFDRKSFGKHFNTTIGKIWGLVKFNWKMFWSILRFRPNFLMSHGSIYAAQAAWLLGKPHISMEDSGNMEQIRLYRPFTKAILVPEVLPEQLGPKEIRYKGYHELFYLHPKRFKPSLDKLAPLGLKEGEAFVILRFVSFNATHDYGHGGFTYEEKVSLVNYLKERYKLFISSESELPEEFKQYQISIKPEMIHHALAFAELVVSEGATIASESGVLGTPTIYVNSIARSYNEDQERFGTVFNFRNGSGVLEKTKELLKEGRAKANERRDALISEMIEPTAFLEWFMENWDSSFKQCKSDPDLPNKIA